jgi:hypothetical protein
MAIFAGGHLHEGGVDIRLLDTTADATLCKAVATYHEEPHHLATINPCVIHEKVVAGHTYRVAARYDNSMPHQDMMGIMLTYVWWGTQ